MARRSWLVLASMTAMAAAGGCYESPDVSLHEPGVYQGPRDPLVTRLAEPALHARLEQRFDRVQRDR